jgi:hypothetical protein
MLSDRFSFFSLFCSDAVSLFCLMHCADDVKFPSGVDLKCRERVMSDTDDETIEDKAFPQQRFSPVMRPSKAVAVRPKPVRAGSVAEVPTDCVVKSAPLNYSCGGSQAAFQPQGAVFKARNLTWSAADARDPVTSGRSDSSLSTSRKTEPDSTEMSVQLGLRVGSRGGPMQPVSLSSLSQPVTSSSSKPTKIEPRREVAVTLACAATGAAAGSTTRSAVAVLPKAVGATFTAAMTKPAFVYVTPTAGVGTQPAFLAATRKDGAAANAFLIPGTALQVGNSAITIMGHRDSNGFGDGGVCPAVVSSASYVGGVILNNSISAGNISNAATTLLVQAPPVRIVRSCTAQPVANAQVQYLVPSFSVQSSPTMAQQQQQSIVVPVSSIATMVQSTVPGGTDGIVIGGSQYFASPAGLTSPTIRTVSLVNGPTQVLVLRGQSPLSASDSIVTSSAANQQLPATRYVFYRSDASVLSF